MRPTRWFIGSAGLFLLLMTATLGAARHGQAPLATITYVRQDADGASVVSTISLDGKTHRDWLKVPGVAWQFFAWSPDGTTLAATGFDYTQSGDYLAFLRTGSRPPRRLPEGLGDPSLAWSPDSRRLLAFLHRPEGPNLFILDRAGRSVRPLQGGESAHAFGWSPDSRTVVFADGRSLYTLPATGREPQRLLHNVGPLVLLDWSPDGQYIAYTSQAVGSQTQRCVVRRADEAVSCLPLYGAFTARAMWSPDSRTLLLSYCLDPACAHLAIGRWQPFPSTLIPLVTGIGEGVYPMPSPDGKHILYLAREEVGTPYNLVIMRADGSHRRVLVPGVAAQLPGWRPALEGAWSGHALFGGGLILTLLACVPIRCRSIRRHPR